MSSPVTDILEPPQDPSPALQFGTFFVYCLVVVVVFLFFFFYFNRAIASLLSRFLGYWCWHRYKAHIEVESIKIALLGGRISFRNLRYVAENQSISVLQGHITFRYWKSAVRDEKDVADPTPLTDATASPSLGPPPNHKMCRIGVRVKGVEWCMYNRTPVFDWIEEQYKAGLSGNDASRSPSASSSVHSSSQDPLNAANGQPSSRSPPPSGAQQQQQQQQQQPSGSSWFRDLFPIEFIAGKGCISIGNPSLPTVLILDWRKANGSYSIVPSRSLLDQYKSLLQIAFHRGQMQFRANVDYVPPTTSTTDSPPNSSTTQPGTHEYKFPSARKARTNPLRTLARSAQSLFTLPWRRQRQTPAQGSPTPGSAAAPVGATGWMGLNRYRAAASTPADEPGGQAASAPPSGVSQSGTDRHVRTPPPTSTTAGTAAAAARGQQQQAQAPAVDPLGDEYAQVHKVVEFVALGLTYYADTVGLADPSLSPRRRPHSPNSPSAMDIGNGDLDPEWGVDLVFYGALVNYGPWADRQRAAMQRFFFPFIYRNAETTPMLNPGEWRVHPSLRIYLRFVGRTVWRVPVREPSKDVKLGGGPSTSGTGGVTNEPGVARGEPLRPGAAADHQPRAYGWLDIGFAGGSATINVPMATQRTLGSTTSAHVHLDAVTLATSVNYVDALASRSVTVNVAMPSPQLWNAPRTWEIGVALDAPVVHLLRDHITLVQDLVADWGAVDTRIPSAPGHPLGVFVPFTYRVKVNVKEVQLRLCVNELNVIDVPNDLAENNYYIIHAQSLAATISIPLTRFQPTTTPVSFSLALADAHAHFSFSPSSTLGAFTSLDARDSIRLARATIVGTYTYHALASPTVPDLLEMSVDAHSGTLTAFGYLARYLILLVDNYVGLTPEYMTLDEYKLAGGRPSPAASLGAPLDTCVSVRLTDIRLVLPEALYVLAPGTLSEMHTDRAEMDVRITPVLMDLQLDIWPVEWTRASGLGGAGDDRLVVAGFRVHGHRMFGQPPANPEYAAGWRIDVDKVEGGISVPGLMGLGRWAAAFDAQMDDFDNRIAHVGEVVRSVMKVGLSVGDVDVVVRGEPAGASAGRANAAGGEAYVHVVIGGLGVEYADLALVDARTDVEVDSIVLVHVLANASAAAGGAHTSASASASASALGQPDDAVEIASVRASDIALHLRARPDDDDPVHQTRVGHIQVHDALTGRLAHLFGHPSVAADAGCGWFAPPFAVDEVEGAAAAQGHPQAHGAGGQHKAAAPADGHAGPGSAAEHYFKSLHSEGDLLQVPGLVVPGMHRSSAPSPLVVDADVANVDGVDQGLLSTPSSDSSTSLRSFATAPDYDQPRGRASTHASSTYGGGGGNAMTAAGGSTTRVRIAVPAVDSSTSALAYRHYLRSYHATASGLSAAAVGEDEEEKENGDGLAVQALFAMLQSSLRSGGKLIYVECLGSLDVVLTPASLAHAPSLIVDTPTCDLLLDSLYLSYLKDSMRKPPPSAPPQPAMIGAVLRKVTVTLVQDCASSDLVKSVIKIAQLDSALGVDAIQLHVHGVDVRSTLLPVNPIAALSGPSDADTVFSASLEHGVFHGSTKIGGTWTGIEVNVAKPDVIPGMLSQWYMPDLLLPSHAQAFLSLASAIPSPIVRDPSFLAQPSNLWRLGVRPHQHNPTWRLLCLFRAHLQSPLARSQLELELASNGLQAFPESRLSTLLQTWKFTPTARPGMPPISPFAFLWAAPEDSEVDALIEVAVNKTRSNVQLDLTKAKIMVEDSCVTLSGIHIASRAGEQVFVHTERVGVTVKPGMLAQVKQYIDDPASLFPSTTAANAASVSPKTTTSTAAPPSTLFGKPNSAAPTAAAATAAASSNKPPDRHFVASIARVDVDVLSPKLSLHLKLRGAMASAVICTHTLPPVGLQAASSSTAQTTRELHTSVSWAVDSGDATLVGSNPLAVISVKDCSGVSGNKHLARVETIVVDLPQNILQLYTFIDEWKSYLERVVNAGATPPVAAVAGSVSNGKTAAAGQAVNKDMHKKPFGGIDFIAPNVSVSLGALPSLTVISRISAALHFSSETAWMLDVSRNDLGFLYAGEAAAVYVTLPTVRVESRGARINVVLGVLQGTVSSETLQPIETSLSLLSREINDVLELLLFLSPKLARSMQQQQPSTASTPATRPGLPSSKSAAPHLAAAAASGVRISCDGVSLSMVTTRGVLQVHSDLITGSKMGDTWSFDSSQLSLSFLSLNRTMLSQIRFALSMSSSATLLRLGLSRFEMMVQPKAMLQLVDLVAFIAGETAVRKKAKETELNQLSSTTQKVMESLDVKPAGGSGAGGSSTSASSGGGGAAAAMIGKRDVHIALDSVSCHLLVDAHHSTELTLHSATLWRKNGEFDVIASDLRLAVDGSSIVFPGCHVLSNVGSWTCQVQPCQLTIQSHLLPSIVVIFDETTNALVSAQTLASSFLASSMETVPSIAATSSGQVNDFANIPIQIDFLGGKGTIIDSSITIPSGQIRLNDGLLWVHVSSSHNVLLPSAVELVRSLMDAPQSTRARTETSSTLGGLLSPMPLSPMPATPRSETMPDMRSSSPHDGHHGGGGGASLPFQVLFVLEPTTIDLKGRKSKCLAQLQFSSTVHVDPAPLHVSVLVPTLSFGIHHPFASEDCVTMRINDITFAYGLDSGLLGQVPSVELKILLRHFLEIREWIDEWTAQLPLSSTAPPESPSTSRSSRQFLTEPLPSPHGTSMRSSMHFDSAPFDFPHSLIKFGKVEAIVQMGQAIGLATVTLPDLFIFAEHRTAHFSSNLAVAVNGRVLSRLDLHSFHATLQFQGHQTMVEAGIERILGTFQYQTAMTTVVDVATVGILLVARGLSADLDIRVGDSVLLTSARAAPAVLNVMQRFKDLVGLSASPSTTPAAPSLSPFGTFNAVDPRFSGHITVLVSLLSLHVYSESLMDPEHIMATVHRPLVHVTVNGGDPVHRVLKTHVDKIKLIKVTLSDPLLVVPPADVAGWVQWARGPSSATPATSTTAAAAATGAAGSAAATLQQQQSQQSQQSQQAPVPIPHRQTKLIAQVPKSDLSMTTWTVSDPTSLVNNSLTSSTSSTALLGQSNPGQVLVRHVFTTQFDGMIDLALNMILYRNLQDVIELYESEISRTMRTLQIIAGPSHEEKAVKFVLEPVEPPVLVPRLRVMGEATPPLEWLVKKELVPELAHTSVTLPLDGFLRGLARSFS